MAERYFGYFVYDDEAYVIRFKIKGSLQYRKNERCFIDKDWYVRSIGDVIAYAAIDNSPCNDKRFGFAMLISHETFVEERARGTKRWTPRREVITWD